MRIRAVRRPVVVAVKLSKQMAKRVQAQDKECFRNALLAAMALEYPDADVRYVEGWVRNMQFDGIAFEHGWVELRMGERVVIVEPTPCYVDGRPREYFAGPKYDRTEIRRRMTAGRGSVDLPLCGPNTLGNKEHMAAYRAIHEAMGRKELLAWMDQQNSSRMTGALSGAKP